MCCFLFYWHSYHSKPSLCPRWKWKCRKNFPCGRERKFPQRHVEKVMSHLRICLSWMTAKEIDQWKRILPSFCALLTCVFPIYFCFTLSQDSALTTYSFHSNFFCPFFNSLACDCTLVGLSFPEPRVNSHST